MSEHATLNAIQVRVLACLIEKQETTPDQYPLTLNSLKNACNQKSNRNPVTAYQQGEIGHTLRELEQLKLVSEAWGGRTAKYSQQMDKAYALSGKDSAILCTLMLRGPQTLGEIKSHSHRLYEFDDLSAVEYKLERLMQRKPALVAQLPKQPGQKEERYAHLLSGEPEIPPPSATKPAPVNRLEQRIQALEEQVEALQQTVDQLLTNQ